MSVFVFFFVLSYVFFFFLFFFLFFLWLENKQTKQTNKQMELQIFSAGAGNHATAPARYVRLRKHSTAEK